jgi:hypothetical protein
MTGSVPLPLSPSGTRAAAAVMVRAAVPGVPPHTASTVVDLLDLITRTVLVDVLGLSPAEALAVLDYLWRNP